MVVEGGYQTTDDEYHALPGPSRVESPRPMPWIVQKMFPHPDSLRQPTTERSSLLRHAPGLVSASIGRSFVGLDVLSPGGAPDLDTQGAMRLPDARQYAQGTDLQSRVEQHRRRMMQILGRDDARASQADIDEVYQRIYEYYREAGFVVAIAKRVLNVVVLAFTIVLSALLIAGVNWGGLAACQATYPLTTDQTCRWLTDYITWTWLTNPQGTQWLAFVYVIILGVYLAWSIAVLPSSVRRFAALQDFYVNSLTIEDSTLASTPWEFVVTQLRRLERLGALPYRPSAATTDEEAATTTILPAHAVALRITRRDNYLVSLAATGLMDVDVVASCPITPTACFRWAWRSRRARLSWRACVRLCAWLCDARPAEVNIDVSPRSSDGVPAPKDVRAEMDVAEAKAAAKREGDRFVQEDEDEYDLETSEPTVEEEADDKPCCQVRRGWALCRLWVPITRTTEAHLRFALINQLFDSRLVARRAFLSSPPALQRQFILQGALHLLVLPFVVIFSAVFWFLSLAEEARSSKQYLGARLWSPHALWLFREYNELPHALERRSLVAVPLADNYLRQFPNPLLALLGRTVVFISGSLLVVLLSITVLVDEQLLTEMQLGSRNLLWYVAILSAVVAAGRSVVPSLADQVVDPAAAMTKVAAHTHHFPWVWRGKEHTSPVRGELEQLFPNRVFLALRELTAIVVAPYLLFFVFPFRSRVLLAVLKELTVSTPNLGDVCEPSLLGKAFSPPVAMETVSVPTAAATASDRTPTPDVIDSVRSLPRALHVAKAHKVARALVSFHCQYPLWSKECSAHRHPSMGLDLAQPDDHPPALRLSPVGLDVQQDAEAEASTALLTAMNQSSIAMRRGVDTGSKRQSESPPSSLRRRRGGMGPSAASASLADWEVPMAAEAISQSLMVRDTRAVGTQATLQRAQELVSAAIRGAATALAGAVGEGGDPLLAEALRDIAQEIAVAADARAQHGTRLVEDFPPSGGQGVGHTFRAIATFERVN
jgi:hypothetical protein